MFFEELRQYGYYSENLGTDFWYVYGNLKFNIQIFMKLFE